MVSNSAKSKLKTAYTAGWLYFMYLALLCVLLYLRDVVSISIPLLVFVGYFTVGYVAFDYDHALAITAMLPLLNHGVQTNYIVLIAIVVYILKYGKGLILSSPLIIISFLMFFELLHVIRKGDSTAEFLRFAVQYVYIGLILGERRIKRLLKNPIVIVKTYIFMAAYFMLDVLLVTLKYYNIKEMMSDTFRFGSLMDVLNGKPSLTDNQNMVALFAVLAITLIAVCLYHERKHLVLNVALIVYFIFFGLFTASRTFIICLLVFALLLLLYTMRKSLSKTILIMIACFVVVMILANTVFADLFSKLFSRFYVEDVTAGRGSLIREYNNFIFSHWKNVLFGIGLQNVVPVTGISHSPHNGIQEIMLCWGVIGIIAFVLLFFTIIKRYKHLKYKKGAFIYALPFIIYLLFIQTVQFVRVTAIFTTLVLLYAVFLCADSDMSANYVEDEEEHENTK